MLLDVLRPFILVTKDVCVNLISTCYVAWRIILMLLLMSWSAVAIAKQLF